MKIKAEGCMQMLENLIGILGIIVTVISIIVTVHNTRQSRDKEKHQASNPPAKE